MCTSWKRNNWDELSEATERCQHTARTYQLLQGAWEEEMCMKKVREWRD